MLWSSSLLEWISSLADRSSSSVVLCSSTIDCRYERVASSSSLSRTFSAIRTAPLFNDDFFSLLSRFFLETDLGTTLPMQVDQILSFSLKKFQLWDKSVTGLN